MSKLRKAYQNSEVIRVLLSPVQRARRALGMNAASKQALKDRHQGAIFESLKNLLVEDPVVRISDFGGEFSMSAGSHLFARLLIDRTYEPETVHLVESFAPQDKDIIDVGANVGFFTVKFAKLLRRGRVLAVEPTRSAMHRLQRNITRNGVVDRVILFEGVVAEESGTRTINLIEGKEEYSTLGAIAHPSVAGEASVSHQVPAQSLDRLVEIHALSPGFVKIDVEGFEHLVFAGASRLLRDHRPIILSEMCDPLLKANGSSAAAVISLIRKADYNVYDADDPSRQPGGASYGNIICFPFESPVRREAVEATVAAFQAIPK